MGLHKLSIPRPSLISSISSRRHTSHTINHDDELVCVTGTCGSLGTWIVKLLLQEGYSVRSTIPHTAGRYLHVQPYIHTHTYTCLHTSEYTFIHTYAHTHAYIHTQTYADV